MTGRRANLLLAVLLPLAVVTGVVSFALGTPAAQLLFALHGAAGLGLLVVSPWKSTVVRRGLRRPRSGRAMAVLLLALVVVAVVTGIAHSAGVRVLALGVTTMQVHVGAALLTIIPVIAHVVQRPVKPRHTDLSRRSLLRSGGVLAAAAGVWVATEAAFSVTRTAGARRRFTGSHEVASFDPAAMPVTSWLNDTAPTIDPAAYRLRVVTPAGERVLSLADLDGFAEDVEATLDCTGGWFSQQRWRGARLDRVLGTATGRSVIVTSMTGYRRRLPLRNAGALWLVTAAGGVPLTAGHGAPVRLVAPGRRGFWWVKWVTEVRVDDAPWWRQSPFPLT